MNKRKCKHLNTHIDYTRCNSHGSPSLCCSDCVTRARKSRYRGQSLYLQWISNDDVFRLLKQGVKLDIRGL